MDVRLPLIDDQGDSHLIISHDQAARQPEVVDAFPVTVVNRPAVLGQVVGEAKLVRFKLIAARFVWQSTHPEGHGADRQ